MTTAKDLTLPSQTHFEQLRSLVIRSGPNKNDQAHVFAVACIESGIDTIARMYEPASRLGLNPRHVARIVNDGVGIYWRKTTEGTYVPITAALDP